MMKIRYSLIGTLVGVVLVSLPLPTQAQFAGTGQRDNFRDTTVLRPPAGSRVALIVFEDLGCPACARAHPFEMEAVKQTHVTLLRYDFPLEAHVWTFEGAVCARYIENAMGAQTANEFRGIIFKSQGMIAGVDDLHRFMSSWLAKRGKKMPAVIDPGGKLAKEVSADFAIGQRLNVQWTPTVVVVTRSNYQVICGTKDGSNDPSQIMAVVKAAIAQSH